jgi:carboxylesterase
MSKFLPNAEPFRCPGNHIGCLLIHGFTGTPYEMRALGNFLAGFGYTISAPALAGHATTLDDMLPTRWTDWYASVVSAYDELRTQCEKIFPIGLSLGGTLALHLAAHRPVDGVVAVSAPFVVENPLIPLFKTLPLLHRFIPTIRKNPKDIDTVDLTIHATHPEYPAIPTRAAASFIFDFLPHLHNDLRDITAPVLLIQSRGDRTIPANSLDEYAKHIRAPKETVWLARGGHLALEDVCKDIAFEHILNFIRKNIPPSTPSSQRI